MEVFAVRPSWMEERMDVNFYRPIYRENAAKIRRLGTIRFEGLYAKSGIGHTASVSPHYDTNGNGIPFVAGKAIEAGRLHIEKTERIRAESHNGVMSKSKLDPGYLLIVRKGDVGNAYVVPNNSCQLNCSSEIMFFVTKPRSLAHYLSAFFNSIHGRLAIQRLQRGSLIPGVSLLDIPGLDVFWPHEDVCAYIGDKVRQAERLRNFEQLIEREIGRFLQLPDWVEERAGVLKSYRAKTSDLHSERLDSLHYDPAHIHLGAILRSKGAKPLGSLCEYVDDRWRRKEPGFFYLEIGNLDVTTGRIVPSRLSVRDAPSRAQRRVQPWDILVSTVRPNRKNVAIVPEVIDDLPIVASTGFSVLRFPSKESAAFYHSWLRCDVATQQLIQWNAGGTYPAIEEEIPLRILVPNFPSDVVEIQGKRLAAKFDAGVFAERLCRTAIYLVEALIEGRLSEDDLKAAEQQLEQGNRELDRAILSRLTVNSVDTAEAPPLFVDLDALYTALDEAERAHTAGEPA